MERIKQKLSSFRFKGIIGITIIFAIITVILFAERSGIHFNYTNKALGLLPKEKVVTQKQALLKVEKDTLVIYDSGNPTSASAYNQFKVIFADMKVGCKYVDLSKPHEYNFDDFKICVFLIYDLSPLGENVLTLCDWVEKGGRAMFPITLEKNIYTTSIESKLGILDSSDYGAVVDSIYFEDGFMVGGGKGFPITDAYESGWAIQLDKKKVKVYAHTDDKNQLPLIWEAPHGKGKFVVCNFGICEKATRGIYAAAYSLLEDICVYPVINGSVFYLDDFPSQIPSGNSEYIQRDYGTTIRDFYINIWWPDMMNIADKYGMKYTGLAIESYDNVVDGTTPAQSDRGTFMNFGNMLLRHGGEIGYHGYNHQPLCFDNCDYKGIYEYKTWDSYAAMKSAFDELYDFCEELFPDVHFSVYVPPSNLLSKEGRDFLVTEYPNIRTISGIYFEEDQLDFSCTQEFGVDKNGVVDQPRVVWGCMFEDFMNLAVLSELNFHFINSHFTHPDDALDVDRGAQLGWEKLKGMFDEYLSYVYKSAPMLRNVTGSEMSAAVQRYVAISLKKEITDNRIIIDIEDFEDDAQLFVRFNKKAPAKIVGGEIQHLTGNLYLVKANAEKVTITLK